MDIRNLTYDELNIECEGIGIKGFRVGQIYDWLHKKLVRSFDEMTNVSKDMRERLSGQFSIDTFEVVSVQKSKEDGTQKFLWRLADNNLIESVLMPYKHGNSVCISSQVGCRMGCSFCASTLNGLERNLSAAEMLEQIYMISRLTGERVSNVVMMGTGEPMDNYDNAVKFVHMITNEKGLNISGRNITISTCGLVPQMRKLAEEHLPITLALSLHAVTDEKRKAIMPVANSYSINELMEACKYYGEETGRRLTFEYSLIAGVNDTEEDAKGLAGLAKPLGVHVNLIPVNPVRENNYKRSKKEAIRAFKDRLEKNGINVTIRREMGQDIDGACGQLRRRYLSDELTHSGVQ